MYELGRGTKKELGSRGGKKSVATSGKRKELERKKEGVVIETNL